MKLKLENHPKAKILRASEELKAEHVEVLRAGLQKLLQSDPKTILVDLTAVKISHNEIAFRLGTLITTALEHGGSLLLAGHAEAMFKTPEEALEKLDKGGVAKPLLLLYAKDYLLRAEVEQLEREKNASTEKLKTLESASGQINDIQKEVSRLKQTRKALQTQLKALVGTLTEKKPSLEKDSQVVKIRQAIDVILQKSGF